MNNERKLVDVVVQADRLIEGVTQDRLIDPNREIILWRVPEHPVEVPKNLAGLYKPQKSRAASFESLKHDHPKAGQRIETSMVGQELLFIGQVRQLAGAKIVRA